VRESLPYTRLGPFQGRSGAERPGNLDQREHLEFPYTPAGAGCLVLLWGSVRHAKEQERVKAKGKGAREAGELPRAGLTTN
jgi:hypothetical protein